MEKIQDKNDFWKPFIVLQIKSFIPPKNSKCISSKVPKWHLWSTSWNFQNCLWRPLGNYGYLIFWQSELLRQIIDSSSEGHMLRILFERALFRYINIEKYWEPKFQGTPILKLALRWKLSKVSTLVNSTFGFGWPNFAHYISLTPTPCRHWGRGFLSAYGRYLHCHLPK